MRTRIYIDGKPIWSENEPGHAVLYRGSIHGTMVTGAPGANDRDAHRQEGRLSRDRLSWNQMHPDDRERIA